MSQWRSRIRGGIERLYVNGDCTQAECGIALGISRQAVNRWVKRWRLRKRVRWGRRWRGGKGVEVRIQIEYWCDECGGKSGLLLHHKDGDVSNTAIGNLRLMCRRCHGELHRGELNVAS